MTSVDKIHVLNANILLIQPFKEYKQKICGHLINRAILYLFVIVYIRGSSAGYQRARSLSFTSLLLLLILLHRQNVRRSMIFALSSK